MTSHDEAMRAEFEKWALSKGFRVGKMANEYLSNQVVSMWEAWRTAVAKVASGEIMISDEDAEAIIEAVYGGEFNSDYSRTKEVREALSLRLNAAARAQAATCACGNPLTLGVVHRKESPCYVAEEAQAASGEPVAWLHTVVHAGMEDTDQALSFSPDNFPLMGEGHGYRSIGREPLYTQPPAPSVSVEALENLADAWDKVCLPHDICVTHARELRTLIAASKKV